MLTPQNAWFGIITKKVFVYTFIAQSTMQRRRLAQALHSLVRVSRRVNRFHLYKKCEIQIAILFVYSGIP